MYLFCLSFLFKLTARKLWFISKYNLKQKYPNKEIGYSGHEYGLVTTFAATAIGATWIERHITMDREAWASDQKSSISPSSVFKLVKGIRDIEKSIQYTSQDFCL